MCQFLELKTTFVERAIFCHSYFLQELLKKGRKSNLVKASPADLQRLLKMKHPVLRHQSRMVCVGQICPMAQLLLVSHC